MRFFDQLMGHRPYLDNNLPVTIAHGFQGIEACSVLLFACLFADLRIELLNEAAEFSR